MIKTDLFIEFAGQKTDYKLLVDTVKESWKEEGNKIKDLESLEMYFKPEERACYYVINGKVNGSFQI